MTAHLGTGQPVTQGCARGDQTRPLPLAVEEPRKQADGVTPMTLGSRCSDAILAERHTPRERLFGPFRADLQASSDWADAQCRAADLRGGPSGTDRATRHPQLPSRSEGGISFPGRCRSGDPLHIDVDPAAESKATQAIAPGIGADDDVGSIVGRAVASVPELARSTALNRAV